MRLVNSEVIAVVLLAAGPFLYGQAQLQVGDRVPVRIEIAETPDAQLNHATKLFRDAEQLAGRNKAMACLEVFANIDVVEKRWPAAIEANIGALLLKDEVGRACEMLGNSRMALVRASQLCRGRSCEPAAEQRLAEVEDLFGNAAAAAQHYANAEKALRTAKVETAEATKVLRAIALFHETGERFEAASRCYRAAARWPKQSPVMAASMLMASMKLNVARPARAGIGGAKADADEAQKIIERAMKDSKRSDDTSVLGQYLEDIANTRARANMY